MTSETLFEHPEELTLGAGLIFAYGLLYSDFVPIIAEPGQMDILLLARANTLLFYDKYKDQLKGTFVEVLLIPTSESYEIDAPQPEFMKFLDVTLTGAMITGEQDIEEAQVCQETLKMIETMCHRAVAMQYSYPVLCILSRLSPQFADNCRNKRPFSLCVLAHIAAILRISIFIHQNTVAWLRQIESTYSYISDNMFYIVDRAL